MRLWQKHKVLMMTIAVAVATLTLILMTTMNTDKTTAANTPIPVLTETTGETMTANDEAVIRTMQFVDDTQRQDKHLLAANDKEDMHRDTGPIMVAYDTGAKTTITRHRRNELTLANNAWKHTGDDPRHRTATFASRMHDGILTQHRNDTIAALRAKWNEQHMAVNRKTILGVRRIIPVHALADNAEMWLKTPMFTAETLLARTNTWETTLARTDFKTSNPDVAQISYGPTTEGEVMVA